jgi:hypothetical protein
MPTENGCSSGPTVSLVHRVPSGGIITVPEKRSARGRRRWVSAQEGKAIEDMTHEELLAELPKLREEAARADARVHAVAERIRETAEVPTYVEVHGDHLVVDVTGAEKAMKLLTRLHIPLEHVGGAEADPEIEHTLWRGWRIPGVHLPGVRFYDVHGHPDKTIVIHLKDETYDRLIVEVQDPADTVAKINDAVGASSRS